MLALTVRSNNLGEVLFNGEGIKPWKACAAWVAANSQWRSLKYLEVYRGNRLLVYGHADLHLVFDHLISGRGKVSVRLRGGRNLMAKNLEELARYVMVKNPDLLHLGKLTINGAHLDINNWERRLFRELCPPLGFLEIVAPT